MSSIMKEIRDDRRGAVAIMTALLLPILVGGLALTLDIAYWRYRQLQLQIAGDTVAVAAVYDLGVSNTTYASLVSNAVFESKRNGCGASCVVTVTWPYNGDSKALLVNIRDNAVRRFFSNAYDTSAKSLQARAVAIASGGGSTTTTTTTNQGSACLLALMGTTYEAFKVNNGTTVLANNCIPASNDTDQGTLPYNPGHAIAINDGSITAYSLTTPGDVFVTSGGKATLTVPASTRTTATTDPYASLSVPAKGTCIPTLPAQPWTAAYTPNSRYEMHSNTTLYPGTYCGPGGSMGSSDALASDYNAPTIDMQPGTYLLWNGGITLSSSARLICSTCVAGTSGVTIIFSGDSPSKVGVLTINNGTYVNLIAPPSGIYAGLVFFQDRMAAVGFTNSNTNNFNASDSPMIGGVIYLPSGGIRLNGGAATSTSFQGSCTAIVAYQIELNQASKYDISNCAPFNAKISGVPIMSGGADVNGTYKTTSTSASSGPTKAKLSE